jgi:penicillin-binding protein 2
MNNELIQKRLFTRRAIILGACQAGLVAGLFGRMFYLQVIKNKEFTRLSENNRIKTEVVPPARGRIFDRSGASLALNEQNYSIIFEKNNSHDRQALYDIALKIGDILDHSPTQQAELINKLKATSVNSYLVLGESLTWKQLVALELSMYELPGASIEIGFDRFYPYGALCGHITGYVGTISNKEMLKSSVALYPNLKIGKNGIEKTEEKILHGSAGTRRIEVNAKGESIRELSFSKSVRGEDINLSIDLGLQQKASKLLGNNTGVVLVSKISTGEILASVSKPDFDPNLFNNGISVKDWNNLVNNPELPLINRSVALTYPPGSGFKVNVALAALKQDFNPEKKFFCPGHYVLGDRTFRCWNRAGHGSINLYQALAGSCNVYLWNVAKLIGVQPIADMARLMGFGSKLLDGTLPREQAGIIPDPAWKKENIGSRWTMADTFNTAIGQGYVEATPMQILTMVSRIAGGKAMMPSILKTQQDIEFPLLDMDRELKIVRKAMEMAVNSKIGTAYRNRITEGGFAMAGKTGTSQVISKRHANDDLSKSNVQRSIKNHGIFVSYAPLSNPEYSFCSIIEHGGSSSTAVKIAKELLTEAQLNNL